MKSLLLGALLLLTSGQSVNFFSLKQDVEIGSVASKEAEQVLPLIRDGNLNRYFRSIGQRITRSPSLPTLQYRFRIVNSKELNSLGFPGGSIYVNRGLIEVAANDAEVAAILAHEIGHVAARHGTPNFPGSFLYRLRSRSRRVCPRAMPGKTSSRDSAFRSVSMLRFFDTARIKRPKPISWPSASCPKLDSIRTGCDRSWKK
jgi:hypothetical protein